MLIFLIFVLVLSFIYLVINISNRRLVFFRLLIYGIIIFIIFQPSCTEKKLFKSKPAIIVLADTSESMSLEQPSRYSLVSRFLQDKNFSNFIRHYNTFFYSFDDGGRLSSLDLLRNLSTPRGLSTNLGGSLDEVIKENKERNLSAIILISDGANNNGFDPRPIAKKYKIPIYCLGASSGEKQKDLSISGVENSEIAFKNMPLDISAEIKATGFENQSITVNLFQKEELIQSRKIKISPDQREKVSFQFTPQSLGKFTYRISIPPYKGELTTKNNQQQFSLNVLRQKVRVLYLCGEPSWEYRFLRRLFKGDPRVEFVSFIILRNPDNIALVPEYQLSLIPFPAMEIFSKQIFDFDLVFFENFSFQRFFPAEYLENVQRFVEKGGGFVMLGGENSFGRGGYKNTAIEQILPVVIQGTEEKIDPASFQLQIEDSAHPLLSLADTPEENRSLWKKMPALEGINCFLRAKKDAAVLGRHPWTKNADGSLVVISGWQYKKGRVLAIASNSAWRWVFGLAKKGENISPYQRFWQQAISWLLQATSERQINLVLPKQKVAPKEEIRGRINVFDQYYRPLAGATVKLFVTTSAGEKKPLPVFPDEEGKYSFTYEPGEEGKYSFTASAWKAKKYLGETTESILVSYPSAEQDNPEFNPALLTEIALESGGKYFDLNRVEFDKIKPLIKKSAPTKKIKKTLWDSGWLYLALILLLGSEWLIRRLKGLW
ncbi:MAG: glutamine amidotransferase [Elusimicrobiota bacterium]